MVLLCSSLLFVLSNHFVFISSTSDIVETLGSVWSDIGCAAAMCLCVRGVNFTILFALITKLSSPLSLL